MEMNGQRESEILRETERDKGIKRREKQRQKDRGDRNIGAEAPRAGRLRGVCGEALRTGGRGSERRVPGPGAGARAARPRRESPGAAVSASGHVCGV